MLILALVASASARLLAGTSHTSLVKEAEFGNLPDGTPVKLFTLSNIHGLTAKIITYGAIVTELNVPDGQGAFTNVLLGATSLEEYLKGAPAAAIMGRVANRIGGARFFLEGSEYKLTANNAPNHLHGNFDKVVWKGKALVPTRHAAAVELTYFNKGTEEGYPGNVDVTATYTLTDKNELRIDYKATTDRATPINLTSHAYFNLAGYGDVLGHELWLSAASYTPTDATLIPTGEIESVDGTPLDFTAPRRIGDRINELKPKPGGYDHNYVLNRGETPLVLAARVIEPKSGRVMEVRTTEPGVQLYTGNHLAHAGLCLETQHYPDSIHHPEFPTTILRPGKVFQSTTVFTFLTKDELLKNSPRMEERK